MQCVQYATDNSLGGCSNVRSTVKTAQYKEKEKKYPGAVKFLSAEFLTAANLALSNLTDNSESSRETKNRHYV